METPESIRASYAPTENETPEQRRKRLASKRAAKYRYYSKVDGDRRENHKERQRKWRETLDDNKRLAIREQNRLRQQARRDKMTADDKQRRNQQQRHRRAAMDDQELLQLRERERLRMRRRREQPPSPTSDEMGGPREPTCQRVSSSPLMRSAFSPPLGVTVLPPATTLGANSSRLLRADDQQTSGGMPSLALRHQLPSQQPQTIHHRPPIEIAPLQFVLPPASSIQSLTFADRMAPLPQVQNVLPHASTLLHHAMPSQLSGPSITSSTTSTATTTSTSSNTSTNSSSSNTAAAPGMTTVAALNPSSPYMIVPSSSSSLGSLLNPPLPSLPPASTATTTTTIMAAPSPLPAVVMPPPPLQPPPTTAVLPSLSQSLPDLFATSAIARDFFDASSTSFASGFFPSIAEFTGDFETTFRT